MSTLNRREREKQELRHLILDKAREIFVHDGYEQFNMRRLAAAIDYSPGTIYLHFADKTDLFACIVDESFARLGAQLAKLSKQPNADPIAALKRKAHAYIEFGLKHPNDYRFAFMMPWPPTKQPNKVVSTFDELRLSVRACIDEGLFGTCDVELAAQTIWASIHGITSLLIQRPGFPWVSKQKLITQTIDMAVAGFMSARRCKKGARC